MLYPVELRAQFAIVDADAYAPFAYLSLSIYR
jgi:hypothetical protein